MNRKDFFNKHNSLKAHVVNFKKHKPEKIDLINNIKLYRPSMQGYYTMAYILNMLNFDKESKQYLRQVLKVAPDDARSYYLLAKIHYKNKQYEEAFLNCRTSISSYPGFRDARILLAKIYIKTNNLEDAQEAIEKIKMNFEEILEEVKNEGIK